MSLSMAIYNHSPIFLQNLFTTFVGLSYRRRRFTKVYRQALAEFKQRDYTDAEALTRYQNQQLVDIVHYAVERSKFYQEHYKGINIDEIREVKDLVRLPLLSKEDVRQHPEALCALDESERILNNTSGTTGTPLKTYFTRADCQRRMAYLDFFKWQHGYVHLKMKRASFNSSKIVPPGQKKKVFWRTNYAIRQRLYSGYHCKGENVKYYVENLNKYKPAALDGYPSALYEVARYILDNHVKMSFTPIAVFPTAEALLPHYREAIERAFHCPVRDQYASSEGAPFITECKCGRLHYCMDTGVIEFQDDGEMIITSFDNHGSPLIRYQIGDRAFLSKEQSCPCGSKLPVVERLEGRSQDYIQSPKTGRFSAIYTSLVSAEFQNSVKAMQFYQDKEDEVEVRLVTDGRYTREMDQIILYKLHYSLGEDMKITIKLVDELEKDPSGKVRPIINKLAVKHS